MSVIPCPCGHQIPFSLDQLWRGEVGRCPGCGAVLKLDPHKNAEVLAILRRVQTKLEQLQHGPVR